MDAIEQQELLGSLHLVNTLLLPPGRKAKKERPYRGNNAFGILGISPDASTKEIKLAYLRLAKQYHPDINHSPDAQKQFIRISQAYTYIMKHGDLVGLKIKCDVVEAKEAFTEFLQVHQRARVLAGVEPDPPNPRPDELFKQDELGRKMNRLARCMVLRCPYCRWKEKCDRATGYAEVEEIHYEIITKLKAKMEGGQKWR